MSNTDLKQKASSGMVWTTIKKYASIIVQFICGVLLARLLTPADYGCIGMLTVFTHIASAFVTMGFASALIQKKRPTEEDYSTIFFWNEGISILMYIILYIAAPFIAQFYRIPLLSDVLRVQGLILIINASASIHANRLTKQFKFKKLAIVALASNIFSAIVAILMAYNGFGVWALVAQSLSSGIVRNMIFWITNKWKPLFVFSMKSFKELFSFGFYVFLGNMVNQIGNSVQTLLIGRIYNASQLGYYSKATHTESLAAHSISDVLLQVTYPLYSELQHQREAMISAISKITMAVSYITFPIMALLILLAKPLFIILYSDRWLPSVPYFQLLCLGGFAACLQGVNYQPIAAIGKSKLLFKWTVIKRIVGTTILIGGLLLWGIIGLLIALVIYNIFLYVVNAVLVAKHIGYKLDAQMQDLLPISLLTAFAFSVAYFAGHVTDFNMYLNGMTELIVFILIYMGGSVLFKMDSFNIFKTIIPMVTKKAKIH